MDHTNELEYKKNPTWQGEKFSMNSLLISFSLQ